MQPEFIYILNITPDSFSDGSSSALLREYQTQKLQCLLQKRPYAVDFGAESTRPGAVKISSAQEIERLRFLPELIKMCHDSNTKASIDTRSSETAQFAVESHADIINDVSGFECKKMQEIAARNPEIKVICMHSLSIPADKNNTIPEGQDPIETVKLWLLKKAAELEDVGISPRNIILDCGIGFGKTKEQCWQILNNVQTLRQAFVKNKLLIGHSRKSFMHCPNDTFGSICQKTDFLTSHLLKSKSVDFIRIH